MSTISVGNVSESVVLAAYLSAGFNVSLPFGGGCAYDLVVDTGTRLIKVQVKTGWKRNGSLIYKVRRRIKDGAHNGMRRYRADEVDFFAIYFPPTKSIFVVPVDKLTGDGNLRLDPALNCQQRLIKWASDFSWEAHVASLKNTEGATKLSAPIAG